MARLRQLGASFSFTRAGIAAVPVTDGGDGVDAFGVGFDTSNDSSGGGSNRGPGGGRRFEGPAKPGAQRILDAMSMATLWDNKVSFFFFVCFEWSCPQGGRWVDVDDDGCRWLSRLLIYPIYQELI